MTVRSASEAHPRATRVRGNGSAALQPGFNKGRQPANKGKRVPAVALSPDEVADLFDAFSSDRYPTGARNRAMATLMYRLGWKPKQVVRLEREDYERGDKTIRVPPATTAGRPREEVRARIDPQTRAALDCWLDHRKRLIDPSSLVPFFCTHSAGQRGKPIYEGYLNVMLRRAAKKAEIDKRVSPLVLRATYLRERQTKPATSLGTAPLTYIDDRRFRACYPAAYQGWLVAVALLDEDADQHAVRIGTECRNALSAYADEVVRAFGAAAEPGSGTYAKVRAALRSRGDSSAANLAASLVKYWEATSRDSNRLAHAGHRGPDQRPLGGDDARRAVFNAAFVMHEIDHALRARE